MTLLANAGVPMLFVGLPYMAAVLLPVVLIEACWYWRFIGVPWSLAWRGSLVANLWSLCLGLLLAWIVWVLVGHMSVRLAESTGWVTQEQFLQSYTVGFLYLVATSGWLFPNPGISEVLLLGAGMVLMLPAFVVSYLSEARILQWAWPQRGRRRVYRHVWLAHVVSYGLLYAIAAYRFCSIT
jgi:hypothetical protein